MGTKNKDKTPHGAKRNDKGSKKLSRKRYSDDKRLARLNCIRHLFSKIPYQEIPQERSSFPGVTRRKPMTIYRPWCRGGMFLKFSKL
jgi:hypothetical protein